MEEYAYAQTTRVSDAVCKTTVGAAKARHHLHSTRGNTRLTQALSYLGRALCSIATT
jgi:hypothetical protein